MQVDGESNEALILASRQGDRQAFARIIERYQRAVYAVAYSGMRDRARADDVTQDTFVLAWRRLDELRDPGRLAPWLCGIARNLARDERKRHRREDLGDAEAVHTTTPFEEMSEAESERIVATALGLVPDIYREPLVLYYYEERSIDDVARSLGISAATTNKRLSRGRRFLVDCVATVERGLVRHGPRPGLAASVLAILGVAGSAAHVDASPTAKGSTMNKLLLAALATGTLAGTGLFVANATRSDAHARTPSPTSAQSTADSAARHAGSTAIAEGDAPRAKAAVAAPEGPSLISMFGGGANGTAAAATTDCAAVGRHLAELEADATHGPEQRPDDATCEQCASHYSRQCEADAWSAERRSCALAAADLVNAHLCAGGAKVAPGKQVEIPANLACSVLGQHIATTVQTAGLYPDVKDMPKQVEAACDAGKWPLELRQCFAAAGSFLTLQACVVPAPASN